jgi:hypothetical protein
MAKRVTLKRGAAVAVVAAAAIAGMAAPASASTISKGFVQICAQGNYRAVVQFPSRGYYESTLVNPGSCWYRYMGGGHGWEQIRVFGDYNQSSSRFFVGTVWYNGDVSGVGIGAEGTTTNRYYITW